MLIFMVFDNGNPRRSRQASDLDCKDLHCFSTWVKWCLTSLRRSPRMDDSSVRLNSRPFSSTRVRQIRTLTVSSGPSLLNSSLASCIALYCSNRFPFERDSSSKVCGSLQKALDRCERICHNRIVKRSFRIVTKFDLSLFTGTNGPSCIHKFVDSEQQYERKEALCRPIWRSDASNTRMFASCLHLLHVRALLTVTLTVPGRHTVAY